MSGDARSANWAGVAAILLWSCLALGTSVTRAIPAFEALAITFVFGGLVVTAGFLHLSGPSGIAAGFRAWPMRAWGLAIAGIFTYHALYFIAFRLAPPGPVTILNYLWPLLIVILAGLLPGGRVRLGWPQYLGALAGFAATVLLVGGGGAAVLDAGTWLGYGFALVCALVWSLYSVLNNRIGAPGSEPMIGVCVAVAILAALGHVAAGETFVMPDAEALLGLALLGAGPVGAAFVAWDFATKKGDIGLLGVLSYAAPPLSMILLVAAGIAEPSWRLLAATALVVGGALLAARTARRPPSR